MDEVELLLNLVLHNVIVALKSQKSLTNGIFSLRFFHFLMGNLTRTAVIYAQPKFFPY